MNSTVLGPHFFRHGDRGSFRAEQLDTPPIVGWWMTLTILAAKPSERNAWLGLDDMS